MTDTDDSRERGAERSVAAAERTLTILDAFAFSDHPMTLGELERETKLFKSVIFRYMLSLERMNYVVKLDDGRYRLGPKLLQLGSVYEQTFEILDIVNPSLDRLMDETGESASFYVREGVNRVCVARRDSPQVLKVSVRPGTTMPLDGTATGLVLTSFAHGAAAGQEPAIIATAGIGEPLTASVSTPVFGYSGRLAGALTVSGPTGRFDIDDVRLRALMKAEADTLSFKLGRRMAA